MGGSHYRLVCGDDGGPGRMPLVDLEAGPAAARAIHRLIARGLVLAAHDCSEGGLLVAAAEMAMAGEIGLGLDLMALPAIGELTQTAECFAETPSRYLLEVRRGDLDAIDEALGAVPYAIIGEFDDSSTLTLAGTDLELDIAELKNAWLGTLDW
jgi:phosphoribosylformylglycinamidine synthase